MCMEKRWKPAEKAKTDVENQQYPFYSKSGMNNFPPEQIQLNIRDAMLICVKYFLICDSLSKWNL